MASGRGIREADSTMGKKTTQNGRIGSHKNGHINGHTNGYKNGVNGRTNGKSDHSNWQENFFESFEETPLFIAILTYIGYAMMVIVGHIRDLLRYYGIEKDKSCTEPKLEGFVPLLISWESFYTRNMYRYARDCFNRPICSAAGADFDVMERASPNYNWNIEYVV